MRACPNVGTDPKDVTQGQTLVLPSRVNAVRNSYDTFKPYSAERAIGDLSPSEYGHST